MRDVSHWTKVFRIWSRWPSFKWKKLAVACSDMNFKVWSTRILASLVGRSGNWFLDLSEGLGVGLRVGIELVMVTVLSRSVLPNTAGKVLELLYIWSIELAVGINASEGGTAPPVLLVVPENG